MNQRVRQERVANGSRRKRDLAAIAVATNDRVPFDREAFAAEHFPNEPRARQAAFAIFARHQGHKVPTPQEVWERMEQRGETRAQLEAKYGELA